MLSDAVILALIALAVTFIGSIPALLGAIVTYKASMKKIGDLALETAENTKITKETKDKTVEISQSTERIDKQTNHTLEELRKSQSEDRQEIKDLQKIIARIMEGGGLPGIMEEAIQKIAPSSPSPADEAAIPVVITSDSFEEGAIDSAAISPDAVEKIADAVISRKRGKGEPKAGGLG